MPWNHHFTIENDALRFRLIVRALCSLKCADSKELGFVRSYEQYMIIKIFIVSLFLLIPVLIWPGDVNNDQKYKIETEHSIGLYKTPEEVVYSGRPI